VSYASHVSLFLPEMPDAIPILAGRVSAQELDSLEENTSRPVTRPDLQTFAKSRLGRIPFLGKIISLSLVVAFA